jgi:predicted Zn-dependent protease
MTRTTSLTALPALTILAVSLGCSDIASPARTAGYDWRLVVAFDSAGPREDTLSFHWPRSALPVRIWVEQDQYQVPDRVREGISRWRSAFLYGEWDAVLVADSTTAHVLIRTIAPPSPAAPSTVRLHAQALSCLGATDVDTVASRFELRVPIRAYVYPSAPTASDLTECLRTVAAHELGHTMGLFQHSDSAPDLMFAVPTAEGLTPRDISTVVKAYHYTPDMAPVRP